MSRLAWKPYAVAVSLLLSFSAGSWAQGAAKVKISPHPASDIGTEINATIARLPGRTGTVQLPPGPYIQLHTISVTGTGIHIVGSGGGTVLTSNPRTYHLVDSADSTTGWAGSGVSVRSLSSIGEDHPDPAQGEGYLEVATGMEAAYQVQKSVPATNFASAAKIGIWVTLNLTHARQQKIQFFVSDGTHTAYWDVLPNSIYGQWKFAGLDCARPSGTDGEPPDMKAITLIGFRNLAGSTKYYFDAVAVYTPIGPSFEFASCFQCSLSNVTVQWEPAADSDAVIAISSDTRDLLLNNVHTVGGAFGFDFNGANKTNTCKMCVAEHASISGFEIRGNSTTDQLFNVQANFDAVGIHLASGSSHNSIAFARCVRNNNVGIFVEGSDNKIETSEIDTWMSFGVAVVGGIRNTFTNLRASSPVGETAIQFFSGAADNDLSSIDIDQSGANGLDFGGGKPMLRNKVTGLTVHHSGSSAWHGGPAGSSEGRGLCVCGANQNSFSHIRIYDTGQAGSLSSGVEGIIITNGSSQNVIEDVLVSNARKEGITVWDAADNTLRNVRLIGNGQQSRAAGIRIEAGAKNTVVEGLCYWMNGRDIKNVSGSSSLRNARQVRDMNPEMECH